MRKQYINKKSFKDILEKSSRYTIVFREDELEECLPDSIQIKNIEVSLEDVKLFLTEFFKNIEESSNVNLGHKYFNTDSFEDEETIDSDSFLTFPKFCKNVCDNMKDME